MSLLGIAVFVCAGFAESQQGESLPAVNLVWKKAFDAGSSAVAAGRHQEAWQRFEEAEAAIGHLPPDDPRRIVNQIGFALVHQTRGEHASAEAIYQRALPALSSPAFRDSALLPLALENLGALRMEQSRHRDAEELTRRAAALFQKLFGDTDTATAKARLQLAQISASLGRFDDALSLAQRAVPVLRSAFPANRPELLRGYEVLGEAYVCLGRYSEAEPWLKEAHDQARTLPQPHPALAEAASNLGMLYVRMDDTARAIPLLRLALQVEEQVYGVGEPRSAPFHAALATGYGRDRKFGLAEQHARRAVELASTTLQEDSVDLARLRSDLGVVLYVRGDYKEAERLFRAVLPVMEANFSSGHPDLFSSNFNLAEACAQMGKRQEAEEHYRKAIEMLEADPNRVLVDRAYAVTRYADFLKMTHSPEAKRWQERAKALRSGR